MASEYIENKLKLLPTDPGVYLMKDAQGHIIYIGKAKNLRNRVRSYFKQTHTGKTAMLVSEITDFETIITQTNKEALLLEVTLIKKHQPRFNIKLKHGTGYPYIKITNERDPEIKIASEVEKDGALYFGPYPDVYSASQTLHILYKVYPLRRCPKNQKRACLYYHMGQCIGPCDHEVPVEEYKQQIANIRSFLDGNVQEVKDILKEKMERAASQMDYEQAADYRDQIYHLENTVEKQAIISRDGTPRDIFAYYEKDGYLSIQVFFIRQHRLTKREAVIFDSIGKPAEELSRFILHYYEDPNVFKPKEILVPAGIERKELEDILDVPFRVPQRGEKKRLLDLATKNAQIALNEKLALADMDESRTIGASEQLSEALGLPYIERIEAFDHSNIQGTSPVSAMVSFKDGKKDRNNYRKYHIKTVDGANEYATTQEVIRRRYSRLLKEGSDLPDLILMDGGEIQVNAAKDVLFNEMGLTIPVAGMKKDDKHATSQLIFGDPLKPVPLEKNSPAFHLVTRIQDEVHRFAITFHRQTRNKHSFSSVLDRIEGVGPKTRQKVMQHFKTQKRAKDAPVAEYKDLGIPEKVAHRIIESLNENYKKAASKKDEELKP